jgi:D-methionine transport system substrate-binding protein
MKKSLFLLPLLAVSLLGSCAQAGASSSTVSIAYSSYSGEAKGEISVCASELPHAKILKECIAPLVAEDGYSLKVTVLDWSIQNDAVAHNEYDANYFQHVPYLKTYAGTTSLFAACKVHYEKLCLYAANTSKKTLWNGAKIELVNDVSNIERALQLLVANNVLTINSSNYDSSNNFANFDVTNPNGCVTFASAYANCQLTCLKESQLCASLPDYDFGIIPGNTALTGLGSDYASRISFGENPSSELISAKANIICVKEANKDNAKTKELVKACSDARLGTYISATFGESVLYHFENGLTTNFLAD